LKIPQDQDVKVNVIISIGYGQVYTYKYVPDLQWMFATSDEPLDKNLVLTG
jgi:hypothetical protein